jgi:hypothetical protein
VLGGETVSVDVLIRNAPLIYGAEVHITFDPAMLAVMDADTRQAGIQITPGSFFDQARSFTRSISLIIKPEKSITP